MPQFIKNAPWYMNQQTVDSMDGGEEALHHQRRQQSDQKQSIYAYHKRGLLQTSSQKTAVTKFRKGACTNCGALTHSSKTCIERPRKIGAKYTGKDICRDEVLIEVDLGWEAKRDQWNGYDAAQYKEVVDEYEMKEQVRLEQRKKKQEEKLKRKADKALAGEEASNEANKKVNKKKDGEEESDSSLDLDSQSEDSDKMDDVDADALNAQFVEKDPKVRTAVRNLRQREDVAKYLRNLDPNSAHYDGKSRIMKENPNPHLRESD